MRKNGVYISSRLRVKTDFIIVKYFFEILLGVLFVHVQFALCLNFENEKNQKFIRETSVIVIIFCRLFYQDFHI